MQEECDGSGCSAPAVVFVTAGDPSLTVLKLCERCWRSYDAQYRKLRSLLRREEKAKERIESDINSDVQGVAVLAPYPLRVRTLTVNQTALLIGLRLAELDGFVPTRHVHGRTVVDVADLVAFLSTPPAEHEEAIARALEFNRTFRALLPADKLFSLSECGAALRAALPGWPNPERRAYALLVFAGYQRAVDLGHRKRAVPVGEISAEAALSKLRSLLRLVG